MSKIKTIYTCQKCAAQFPKWIGQCMECGTWNSLVEESASLLPSKFSSRFAAFNNPADSVITNMAVVELCQQPRITTTIAELDRVLGVYNLRDCVVLHQVLDHIYL